MARPYSYAFGRSNHQLEYYTIGNLLNNRVCEQEEESKNIINEKINQHMFISHHEGIRKTFTEFNNDVNRLTNALHQQLSLKRGDVIGVWSCNTYNWVVVQYAAAKLGAILCTINPYYQAQELNYVLRKADIKCLFMPGTGSLQQQINRFESIFNDALKIENDTRVSFV